VPGTGIEPALPCLNQIFHPPLDFTRRHVILRHETIPSPDPSLRHRRNYCPCPGYPVLQHFMARHHPRPRRLLPPENQNGHRLPGLRPLAVGQDTNDGSLFRAQGTVIVDFGVSKKGKAGNFRVSQSVNQYLDAEALRVMKMMPEWIPSIIGGIAAESFKRQPIIFSLQDQ
jgi:TonB family protein